LGWACYSGSFDFSVLEAAGGSTVVYCWLTFDYAATSTSSFDSSAIGFCAWETVTVAASAATFVSSGAAVAS